MLEFEVTANIGTQSYDIVRYFRGRAQKVQKSIPVIFYDVTGKDGESHQCTKKQAWNKAKKLAEAEIKHLNRKKWRNTYRKRVRDHEAIKEQTKK